MKRVAVIIFGQPRFFNITWPLIKQEFDFSPSDIEVDYYIHFWDAVGHTPASSEVSVEEYGGIIDVLDNEFSDHNVQMTDYTDLDPNHDIFTRMISMHNINPNEHKAKSGCFLSHVNLWKHIVEHKLNDVLIVEDDAEQINELPRDSSIANQ